MEQEQHNYVLRSGSRSRSVTPQVFLDSVGDHQYDLRHRSRDRSQTPAEVTSTRRSSSKSISGSAVKHHNMTIIEEIADNQSQMSDTSSTSSRTLTNTVRKVERRSERQRVKRQLLANGQSEAYENTLNSQTEQNKRNSRSATPRKIIITSDYSSEGSEREDHPKRAHEIYREAGEWWNVFPKTDYTYSPTSQCRYEVAPGVLAMPNMSRRPIHSDELSPIPVIDTFTSEADISDTKELLMRNVPKNRRDDVLSDDQIYQTTVLKNFSNMQTRRQILFSDSSIADSKTETHPMKKYDFFSRNLRSQRQALQADSDQDEMDNGNGRSIAATERYEQWRVVTWSKTVVFTILTVLTTIFNVVTFNSFRAKERPYAYNYRHYQSESRWSRFMKKSDSYMQYFYFLLVKILLLDTWLLSRLSTLRQHLHKRHGLLWLILLPPLLFGGCWLAVISWRTVYPLATFGLFTTSSLLPSKVFQEPTAGSLREMEELRTIVQNLMGKIEKLEAGHSVANDNVEKNEFKYKELLGEYELKLSTLESKLNEKGDDKTNINEMHTLRLEVQNLRRFYHELKSCCDNDKSTMSVQDVERRIEEFFVGFFGADVNKNDLKQAVRRIVTSKDDDETPNNSGHVNVTIEELKRIVAQSLRIYDADKTGRVDYALETAGGQVISTRCTQRFNVNTRVFKLFGIPLYYESNDPRTVIQGNPLQPGVCWAFQDFPGYLLVKLRSPIYVTGFTIEHVPRLILPNGEMKSAPRKFNVWGLQDESDLDPVMFGEYEFQVSDDNLQYFPVQNTSITTPYEFVELRIHSNHGQLEYTCVYRFRVHGNLL